MHLLKEIEEAFGKNNPITVDNEAEFIDSKEIMELLVKRDYIAESSRKVLKGYSMVDKPVYTLQVDFSIINSWINDQNMKAKRPSRREWKIAVFSSFFSAVTGFVIGILTSDKFLDLIANFFEK